MITFLVHPGHSYTLTPFIQRLDPPDQARMQVRGYFDAAGSSSRGGFWSGIGIGKAKKSDSSPDLYRPGDVVIFADLERLLPSQIEAVASIHILLAQRGVITINPPAAYLQRYDLIRTLFHKGIHPFNAYRASDVLYGDEPQRYPVLIRNEREHSQMQIELVPDREALLQELTSWPARGICRDNKIVIEWADTRGPDGFYRKYGAYRVGDQIVRYHLMTNPNWIVRMGNAYTDALLAEEQAYIHSDAHEALINAAFETAGNRWGRLDYSITRDGEPVIFEMNTNPSLLPNPARLDPRRHWIFDRAKEKLGGAIFALERSDSC